MLRLDGAIVIFYGLVAFFGLVFALLAVAALGRHLHRWYARPAERLSPAKEKAQRLRSAFYREPCSLADCDVVQTADGRTVVRFSAADAGTRSVAETVL